VPRVRTTFIKKEVNVFLPTYGIRRAGDDDLRGHNRPSRCTRSSARLTRALARRTSRCSTRALLLPRRRKTVRRAVINHQSHLRESSARHPRGKNIEALPLDEERVLAIRVSAMIEDLADGERSESPEKK
jgi:hypothetical protein